MKGSEALAQLDAQVELLAGQWGQFSEAELRHRPGPGRWSKKEILGHLVDSATNNHGRFVRVQAEPPPLRLQAYDQEVWVRLTGYQHVPSAELLAMWVSSNRLVLHLLVRIPEALLATECITPNNTLVTLGWLINDYVLHLEHHVQQILFEHE